MIKRPLPESIPPYARKTAATVAGAIMKSPEVLEARDKGSIERMVGSSIGEHEKLLQEERQADPDRYLYY